MALTEVAPLPDLAPAPAPAVTVSDPTRRLYAHREAIERAWGHYWHYHRPLKDTLTQIIGDRPRQLLISPNRDGCTFGVPLRYNPGDNEKEALIRAVCDRLRLGLDACDVAWHLYGRKPEVVLTRKELLPTFLTWADVKHIVKAAEPDQLLCGLGKANAAEFVSTKLDSPHFGIAMGTGGGKSNTAAFWLTQELMRGAVALILDAKWISHPWAFKDIDANYGQLPNIAYARSTADLHNAAIWLGAELQRRTEEADRYVNSRGDILGGDIGPTLWILAEELNLAVPRLKQYWAAIRDPKTDPKRSPALDGMAAVAFAGRAVRMHLIVIGQMLTAAVLGGGDVRENIGVRMLARYSGNSWKMHGDLPMPPGSDIPGRVQVIASGAVHEAQVPLMDLDHCRQLAVSKDVTECPDGMPGIGNVERVPLLPPPHDASELGFVLGHGGPRGRPPGTLTLREAASEGLFPSLPAARKAAQRYELEHVGREGSAHLYLVSDLVTAVRGKRG